MENCWLEDEGLTVLKQSEILEYSLLNLNPLNTKSYTMRHKRRAASVGDSVSSQISAPTNHQKSCDEHQTIEKEKKEQQIEEDTINEHYNKGRSWSGSPHWDFKEGCSYDVQNYRTYGALEFIKQSNQGTISLVPVNLSNTIPVRRNQASDDPFHVPGSKPVARSSLEDVLLLDSARDARSSDENEWDVHLLYSSVRSAPSDISITSSTSHRIVKSDTAMEEASIDATSFLQKVRNELDIDVLERDEEESSEIPDDDIAALEAASPLSESEDDPNDRPSNSRIGNVLNLVVGIGACAIFQFLK